MNLAEWLAKIQKVHPLAWDLGLERVGEVGRRLKVLKPAKTVFLVAGTNGKGSTCEYLAGLCNELGLTYGKTTSPYLQNYNEQIVVDGDRVDDAEIVSAFEIIDETRGDITLTYFEYGALAALHIFTQKQLDVAIVEIGLGGRLDAMNIVDADISIITRIDVDHQNWLGDTREAIAREKAGILRTDRPCIFVDPDPPDSLFEEVKSKQAICNCLGRDFFYDAGVLNIDNKEFLLRNCLLPESSAVAAVCSMLVAGFDLDQQMVDQAVSKARLPGRYQIIDDGINQKTILDVAHNPNAAEYLLKKLKEDRLTSNRAVVGMYADKDIGKVFEILSPVISEWYLCDTPTERGAKSDELVTTLSDSCGLTGRTYDKISSAYKAAKADSKSDDVILVFGSFPVVAAVLRHLDLPV